MIYKSLHFQQMQNSTVMYFKLISSYIFWLNCHHQGADTIVLKLNSNKIFNDAYTYQMYWLKFIRNKMFLYIFILTLYGMSFLCEVRYETVHGSVCCYMCINQCACAMLLPCLCHVVAMPVLLWGVGWGQGHFALQSEVFLAGKFICWNFSSYWVMFLYHMTLPMNLKEQTCCLIN